MKKLTSVIVCFFFLWTPTALCWGDAFTDTAAEGQSFGKSLFPGYQNLGDADEEGNITVFPGTDQSLNLTTEDLFPGAGTDDVENYTNLFNDQEGISEASAQNRTDLESQNSFTGEAYRAIIEGSDRSHPDMSSDPVWGTTDQTLEDVFAGEFSECELVTNITESSWDAHVPEFQTCERLIKPQKCVKERRVEVLPVNFPEKKVFEFNGCFDHNYKEFRVFEEGIEGNYSYSNKLDEEIESLYPGYYEGGSLRGDSDDLLPGDYFFSPMALAGVSETGLTVFPRISSAFSYNVPAAYAAVDENATQENGWKLKIKMEDPGTGYGQPPCANDDKRAYADLEVFVQATGFKILEYGDETLIDARGSSCVPGEIVAGPFTGRKADFTYHCGEDGFSISPDRGWRGSEVPVLPLGENVSVGNRTSYGFTQTCEDFAGGRLCTLSGGTYNRYHPSIGGYQYDWDYLHTQSSDTYLIANYEPYEEEILAENTCDFPHDFCTREWVCDEIDNERVINGVVITPEIARANLSPLYPDDPMEDVCWKATARYTCDYNIGTMDCWTDPQGVVHCPENNGETENSCVALEEDPSCGFVRQECVEGARSPSGICYIFTEIYDCGYAVDVPTATREDIYDCDGEIRCMGSECVQHPPHQSQDFARASAMLSAAQNLAFDINCSNDPAGNVVGGCQVFQGDPLECKKAVGGTVDCCDTPTSVSLSEYLQLTQAMYKTVSAENWLGGMVNNPTYGTWQTVQGGAEVAWQELSRPFVNAWESIAGPTTESSLMETASTAVSSALQTLTDQTAQWVLETFGEAAVNALFESAAGTAASETLANGGSVQVGGAVGGAIASALSVVMWAYLVYQIAKLLIQIIYECEDEEFELGVKRELKSCTFVGSYCADEVLGACIEKRDAYCCFNSPLSRILQEQIRAQLGIPWGGAENPSCNGIPLEMLEDVNWDLVNLDEYVGILQIADMMPTVDSENLNPDDLTGPGSELDTSAVGGDPRLNTTDRTLDRIDGTSLDGVREQVRQDLWGQY